MSKTGSRLISANAYASSLISFNCSLNGDINLRNFEITSAGGFLLTDKLSPQSGFNTLFKTGLDCDTYASRAELLEKIAFYLENPSEAVNKARLAHRNFLDNLQPDHRINNLLTWVFNGELPVQYLASSESRFSVSRDHSHLLETRLEIYEQIQELIRVKDSVNLFLDDDCPVIIAIDLVDLVRVKVHLHLKTEERANLLKDAEVESQITWASLEPEDMDVYISKRWQPERKARLQILLDVNNYIVKSDLENILRQVSIRFTLINQVLLTAQDHPVEQNVYPILNFIGDVKSILDIGANVGASSAYFREVYPDAYIYACEKNLLSLHFLSINSYAITNCDCLEVRSYVDEVDKVFRKATSNEKGYARRKIDILKIDVDESIPELLISLRFRICHAKVIYVNFHNEEEIESSEEILRTTHFLITFEYPVNPKQRCYLRQDLHP